MAKRKHEGKSLTPGVERILNTAFPPQPDMTGVMNLITNIDSAAASIGGLANTLQELDEAKHCSRDEEGLLEWYTGAGGFHSGAIQKAIELLADTISSNVLEVGERLKPGP